MQSENIKEVSAEMQQKQFEIDSDLPFKVQLGKKTYKVTYLKEWVGRRFSYEIAKKNSLLESESENYDQLKALNAVGYLPSKCLSIAILNNWIKIKLFHWIFWRYISIKYTQSEINKAINDISGALELEVFFYNIASLENLNQLRIKMTQVEALQYRQEQVSVQKQTS
jgi:hypothetical protein